MSDKRYHHCTLCPKQCVKNREEGQVGFCQAPGEAKVALATPYFWEEPCICGSRGTGAIFFSCCNMKCIFCQNSTISHGGFGKEVTSTQLARIMLHLQQQGVQSISLISPTPYLYSVSDALYLAREMGLILPVVYNTNAYETVASLKKLEGLIDIYLPDLKYFDDCYSIEFSKTPHYFTTATEAILEMRRQTGPFILDSEGVLQKGLVIRHLVLPGCYKDSMKLLDWIQASIGDGALVSLLRQYTPCFEAIHHKQLSRPLTTYEYQKVVDYFFRIGLKNGFMQQKGSATKEYTPIFDGSGIDV